MATKTEKHWAVVTDNDDPDRSGRLKVQCQGLVGAGVELPDWIPPANAWFTAAGGAGALFLPVVDSMVELEVDVTDEGLDDLPGERFLQSAATSIRWKPAPFTDLDGQNPLPTSLRTNYPNRRGWRTPSGHYFLFDDQAGQERVQLIHRNGGTFVDFAPDGSILILTAGGSLLWLRNDSSPGAFLIDQNGNSVALDAAGMRLISRFGDWINMRNGVVDVSGDLINVMGGQINLEAGQVNVGGTGATEPIPKGTSLAAWLNAHVHPTGVGPSGPPTVVLPPAALSTAHRVGG